MRKYIIVVIINVLLISTVYAGIGNLRIIGNPAARSYACMIADSINERAILFGGGDYRLPWGQFFNDVWSLDFNTEAWKLITPEGTSPAPRSMAAAAYNPAQQEMIIFGGGVLGYSYFGDVWTLDLTMGAEAWTEITASGNDPGPLGSATAIVDPVNNRLIVFGGEYNEYPNNSTWSLDLTTWTWTVLTPTGTPPPARFEHSAVYDPSEHRMIIYGGKMSVHYDDVWALDLTLGSENWQRLYPGGTSPGTRGRHFCAYSNLHNEMVVGFGYSYLPTSAMYSDAWALNLGTQTWRQILQDGSVGGRRGSCAAFNSVNSQVVIFGGDFGGDYYVGNTYALAIDSVAIVENQKSILPTHADIKILSNPSGLPCRIHAYVPIAGNVALKIFDTSGRLVDTLVRDRKGSGNYIVQWDGKDNTGKKVSRGTYFINLEIDGVSLVEKMVLIE